VKPRSSGGNQSVGSGLPARASMAIRPEPLRAKDMERPAYRSHDSRTWGSAFGIGESTVVWPTWAQSPPGATAIFACYPRIPAVTMPGPGPATLVTPRIAPHGEAPAPPTHHSLALAPLFVLGIYS
jgi:hypothetical protein